MTYFTVQGFIQRVGTLGITPPLEFHCLVLVYTTVLRVKNKKVNTSKPDGSSSTLKNNTINTPNVLIK